MTWEKDYTWQYGHEGGHDYDLLAQLSPAGLASRVFDALRVKPSDPPEVPSAETLWFGGSWLTRDGDSLVLTSSGEDAIDSLEALADAVAVQVRELDATATITWVEQPPRDSETGAPAQRIDGYWIAAADVDTYRARRARALDAVREAFGDAAVEESDPDGISVIVVRPADAKPIELLVGVMQLEMIEQAMATGGVREYVLGD